ncbi:trypsin-1-like isoform X2 [Palaemon carinicauda]|uniref:trypsin-1-like isoform X2 n=1 Tax=Palaemon carinicauda TaxID=392227 RepID=UPI0035B656D1
MTSTAAPNTTTTITANSSSSTPPITRLYCDDDCGRSVITVPRIVGGQEATTHEYPWQVHLSITADAFTSPGQCGASIIKRSWLLTAAHCLVDPDTSELYSNINVLATLAEHDLNNETETQRIRIFPSFVFVHPEYKKGPDASSEEHDIALLFIDGTLTFGSTLKPLCMPQPEDYVADKGVIATGWGVTSFQGDSSNVLREVSLTLKSQEECKTLNENAPETYIVTDNMICTLGEDKDACQGDSGGPLITRSADGRWIQLGIVSFGYKCAEPNVPGFYTNLANYVDWITNVTLSSNC